MSWAFNDAQNLELSADKIDTGDAPEFVCGDLRL